MCVQVSLVPSAPPHTMAATATVLEHIIESTCVSSFVLGDHDTAARLLPSLQQPTAAVRTSYTFTDSKFGFTKQCTNVSLLHLAALHGWMDIVGNLVSMSDCDIQCRDGKEYTPLHYAAYGGSLPVVKYFITEATLRPKQWRRMG